MAATDLQCPNCDVLLKKVDSIPEPTIIDGRMRFDIDCPNCAVPLVVFLEIVDDDGITVRKFVEFRGNR